jgi:hypothetical protein
MLAASLAENTAARPEISEAPDNAGAYHTLAPSSLRKLKFEIARRTSQFLHRNLERTKISFDFSVHVDDKNIEKNDGKPIARGRKNC